MILIYIKAETSIELEINREYLLEMYLNVIYETDTQKIWLGDFDIPIFHEGGK